MRRTGGMLASMALAFLLALVPNSDALAQQTGSVRGMVTSTDGDPVSGATVMIEGTALGTLTGADGSYMIEDVPAGTHTVRAQSLGYRSETQTVTVSAGMAATADFTLSVDALSMEQIVVTGTPTQVRKVESSFAVTTMTADELEQESPLSTADLLEVVPGFYTESSGGQGGNNVWARGIPQDGSFRYVAVHEDGLPVYESPELAFANIDNFFRTDATVRTMEAVRGGSASIFASNAPGGLINFVSKTGGEELAGEAKLTVGDYSLFRVDGVYSGPIADGWKFMVGGHYRYDDGIRDPGFPANQGGQLKANLTKEFDGGYFRLRGKHLDDNFVFYLPIPLQNPDDPEGIPGFDPNYGTMTSLDAARVKILNPEGSPLERDLRRGVDVSTSQVGGEVFFELGDGWSVKENMRAMSADLQFNAIFSVNNPVPADTFATRRMAELGGTGYDFSYANHPGTSFSPSNANGNGLVAESGWWTVTKPMSNFSNDLRITKEFEDNSFTAGFYFSNYNADDFWSFNNILTEVRDQPRMLDLTVTGTPGGDVNVTDNGFTRYGAFYRNAQSSANVFALYAQDEWQATEDLRIDGGLRFEYAEFTGNVETLSDFDLGDPTTTADDQVTWGTGDFRPYAYDFDELSISIGANYSLSDQLALFGRFSDGYRMPDFDNWADGSVNSKGSVEDVVQWEGGVKYGSPTFGVFATGFFSSLTDIPFVDEVVDPATDELITLRRFGDAETIGAEVEVVARPTERLQLQARSTLQRPELTDLTFDIADPSQFEDFDFSGNQVRRVPEFIFTFTPSYEFGSEAADLELFGSFHHVSERFVDDANEVTLPAWSRVSAGFSFQPSSAVTVELRGRNLTNTIGLTEGNPRVGQVVGQETDIFMARPILGRSGQISIKYAF